MNIQIPLKWAGGKRWIVPYILPIWEKYKHHRLVEPFCGGLSVSLTLLPKNALLNDINPHLINFYEWLKKGFKFELEMINNSSTYYRYRQEFNELIMNGCASSQKAAELFYYLNRTGFNGLCRFNKNGEFNVPFGRYTKINYHLDTDFYKNIFSNWTFSAYSYEDLCLDKNDFIFVDPPYDVNFKNYTKDGFRWDDHLSLTDWLCHQEGPIILCNQATDRVLKLYKEKKFDLHYFQAPIRIAANGKRSPANIVVATRNIDPGLDFKLSTPPQL